jgi:archaeal cell division control protein 6
MSYDFLSSDQTIFSNPDALDPDFVPKKLPHREGQQDYIASSIKPLFHDRDGKNILVWGSPGIGKTAATKRVLKDLEEVESDKKVTQIFINCWRFNTTYKVLCDVSRQFGYPFTQTMRTNEVMEKITEKIEKFDGVVFVFDEIDKADDYDFLYFILEEFPKKTLILITNEKDWGADVDNRIRSRLVPETIEFKSYTSREVFDILAERKKYAFYENTWSDNAFETLAEKAAEYEDIRVGIKLLKVAGEIAENDSTTKVTEKHVAEAIARIDEFKIKNSADLTDEDKFILSVCEKHTGKRFGVVYEAYSNSGGVKSKKTFRRKLEKLQLRKLVELKQTGEGFMGRSTIINFIGLKKRNKIIKTKSTHKGLDEF